MEQLTFKAGPDIGRAKLKVKTGSKAEAGISKYITGKFCEHLWSNIYNGMEAQILLNPTFGDWPFCGGGNHPDGGIKRIGDEEKIYEQIRGRTARYGWPDPEKLVESRRTDLAHWWIREGSVKDIRTSSDAGPFGQRAQRIEVQAAGQGIAQYASLPLHRVRAYEYRIILRSNNLSTLRLSIHAGEEDEALWSEELSGLGGDWQTIESRLELPDTDADDGIFRIVLTAPAKGQFVIDRLLLYPADHINYADPDIIRFLKDSRLPVLRWPGGNFVSGYHWRDGVGPVDARPTLDNPAWSHIEPGMFGTDEFIAFCEAVGTEPMICINAGNGNPEEAADWLEYCNGSADTPMGKLRADNGHTEPYNVKFWEIGNELSGTHQVGWTTSAGYADRYGEFSRALLARDPAITLMACGAPVLWGGWTMEGEERVKQDIVWTEEDGWNWNRLLIRENLEGFQWTTDHILEGGGISPDADPLEVYRDFMAIPILYENWYAEIEKIMQQEGVADPRLAVTELQLFGRLHDGEGKITHATLVNPASVAECVYQRLYYHMAVRLTPFIPMITHSATVNHGGCLRKQKERVYANPCNYSRGMFADFADAMPCAIELECGLEKTSDWLHRVPEKMDLPVIDAVAALSKEGDLLLSLVHRGISGTVELSVDLGDFNAAAIAEATLIKAVDKPWDQNSLDEPEKIIPQVSEVAVADGRLALELPLCSVMQIRIAGKG